MSNKKGDYVKDSLYGAHLHGDRAKFANSPTADRMGAIQRMHVKRLTELAANRFEWTNLPEEIDPRFLELNLFYRALTVFFKDDTNDKYFALRGSPNGPWDIMDNPLSFQVTGNQFTPRTLSSARTWKQGDDGELVESDAECVPIWANYLRVPDLDVVLIYAYKFADLDMTIEINAHNARRNKVVAVDENQQLSATNINREIDNGSNFVALKPDGMGALPTALDLGILPDSIEKLHILRVRLENECMGMLGINNANQDKKERLVADEVAANDKQVQATKNVALNSRRDAAAQINKLYGLNIEVNYHEDNQPESEVGTGSKSEPTGPVAVEKVQETAA